MTREHIETQCQKISANYSPSGVCRFARGGGTLCFIDTSPEQNGTRGIAFLRDEMTLFFGSGRPCDIAYSDIKGLQIISSFEDFFADELAISGEDFDVRISDYSLDKSELKRFIEELCVESKIAGEHRAQAEEYAKIIAQRLSENAFREEHSPETRFAGLPVPKPEDKTETAFAEELHDNAEELDSAETDIWGDTNQFGEIDNFDEFVPEEGVPVITESTIIEIPSEKVITVPEDYAPMPIPEEKINWISGSFFERKLEFPEETPVITADEPILETVPAEADVTEIHEEEIETVHEKSEAPFEPIVLYSRESEEEVLSKPERLEVVEEAEKNKEQKEIYENSENINPDSDTLVQIQNMSREETLSFLAESLSEINGVEDDEIPDEPVDEPTDNADESELPFDIGADLKTISEISALPEEPDDGKLTVEPIWGDIYIKASRNLRELIESGRLSMEQIETELKEKLLSSARAFADITADKAKVPKVLMPRITELRSAANDIDQYFKSGEDIAERAMFFMMYQMLSYADRIAETPETKERLNDFFRRFGPAGITLSMLDMRV